MTLNDLGAFDVFSEREVVLFVCIEIDVNQSLSANFHLRCLRV